MPHPSPEAIARLSADLDTLAPAPGTIGIAVSGGPDSLALLLLACAARPGGVEAATVDHALRPGSGAEAQMVLAVCQARGIRHATLTNDRLDGAAANLQARAREARYEALEHWARERGLHAIATAHHLDDQAETVLMRLARGAGIGGLAGIQRRRQLGSIALIRPLLDWRRDELHLVLEGSGLQPVDDPANTDERFDRTRARALLAQTGWLDPARLAQVATNAGQAEEALEWAAAQAFACSCKRDGAALWLDAAHLPPELQRRLLVRAIAELGGTEPRGPKLTGALDTLSAAGTTTLSGLKLEGGHRWRVSPAPPRAL